MTALEELLKEHKSLTTEQRRDSYFIETLIKSKFDKEKQQIIDAYIGGVNSGSFVGTHFVFKGNANDYYKTIKR